MGADGGPGLDGKPGTDDSPTGDSASPDADASATDGSTTDASVTDASASDAEGGVSFDPGVCKPFAWDGVYRLQPGRMCSHHGVCMVSPAYFVSHTTAVWGSSENDVWYSGPGIVVHAQNRGALVSGVSAVPVVTEPISGSGPNDVWLGVLHWDGATLVDDAAHAPPGRSWFAAANDAWAVHGKSMAHWDGVAWTDFATPAVVNLQDVFGFASNDVYAVGGIGLLHWDGATWSAFATALPVGGTANRIWGSSTSDFWVAGDQTRHFTGGAFTSYNVAVTSLWGRAGELQYTLPDGNYGRFTGSALFTYTWSSTFCRATCGGCNAIWTAPNGDIHMPTNSYDPSRPGSTSCGMAAYVVGELGYLNRQPQRKHVGGSFVPRSDGSTFGISGKRLFDGRTSGLGGEAGIRMFWGLTNDDDALFISGLSDDDIWVAGNSPGAGTALASRWDGAAWTYKTLPDVPSSPVHATSATSAWVVAGKNGTYFDGVSWTDKGAITPGKVVAIWGDGPSSAIAVGDDIYRWDGATWTKLNSGFSDFLAVGKTGASRITAVRDGGDIVVLEGGVLHPVTTSGGPAKACSGGSPGLCRLRSFVFRGGEIWATGAVLPKTYFTLQPHLWRLSGSCWAGADDGARINAVPALGALGDRVTASDGNFWLDAPPP